MGPKELEEKQVARKVENECCEFVRNRMRYLDTWSETEKCVLRRKEGQLQYFTSRTKDGRWQKTRPWHVPRGIPYFEIQENLPKETVHLSMEHSSFIHDLVHPSKEDNFPTLVFLLA